MASRLRRSKQGFCISHYFPYKMEWEKCILFYDSFVVSCHFDVSFIENLLGGLHGLLIKMGFSLFWRFTYLYCMLTGPFLLQGFPLNKSVPSRGGILLFFLLMYVYYEIKVRSIPVCPINPN